jgi:hypothetical protein
VSHLSLRAKIKENIATKNLLNTPIEIKNNFKINIKQIPSIFDIQYFQLEIINNTSKMFDIIVYDIHVYYDFNDIFNDIDKNPGLKSQLLECIKEFLKYIYDNPQQS